MAAQEPSPPPSSPGSTRPGFPCRMLHLLQEKHVCLWCQEVLRRPLQARCGHRYCFFCFHQVVSSGPQKCSACIQEDLFEEPTSILTLGGAFPDNAARREIEGLAASCPNEGCSWTGTIKEYEAGHEADCTFQMVLCPSCKELMRADQQERHSERECPERTLNCKFCKEPFLLKNIKAHDEICPKYPLICEGCAKTKIPRDKHLNTLLHFIMGIKVSLEGLQPQSLDVASHRLQELHRSLRDLEHKMNLLGGGVPPRVPALAAAAAVASFTARRGPAGGPSGRQPHSEKTEGAELGRRCQQLELKTDTFQNIVCVLNREVERSVATMETYNSQHRLDQDKIEILSNKVRQLERTVGLRELTIMEMEGKMREMSAATFDGVFVWKISDFTKKRQDAVVGRAPAMFSQAFYTSKYGYKMCLRIYLNGDGTGRSSHLSLFFVVMRGHSDALVKWPFNQKVTLMLLDQNNREHIIDAFRPDISSSSFQRPVSDMNIASGCPLFCPLAKLESKNTYIRDDTIFIKAVVDLTGL
ncbi:hypothetical protein NHX12_029252 [Muraenolepis orangiensis]|uniref:TNF receptor-associated factor n=1 Tax=Muraenolepis orangiensis TaxID=630683 RepID=A0A9Q0IL06_9TELE|nr:hypothetical protein NHX12_029252 [Muraenolepis orangiensis]